MAKFQIAPNSPYILTAAQFVAEPDGTLGKIVDLTSEYDGEIVILKGEIGVVSLSHKSGWLDFEETDFRVERLPKGAVVTLTQE